MKYLYSLCIAAALWLSAKSAVAQITTQDMAVMVTATVDTVKPSVTLNWDVNPISNGYRIFRKTINSNNWGSPLTILGPTTQTFIDSNVVLDSAYEYWVYRSTDSQYVQSDGYLYASIKRHPIEYFGKVILLVDSTYRDSFAVELNRLKFDLIGDGWQVIRHDVSENDSVTFIRQLIKTDYFADTANVTTVFIFGHVPVPYSGDIVPDGHVPYHVGAWPADGIYGDVYGVYTDSVVDDTEASYTANWNVPGDGKYDQSTFSGKIMIGVGRVDLSNMDSFALSEPGLLKQYLNKDHAFRQKKFTARPRGMVCDNFGPFYDADLYNYEAFASCGWRDYVPMFGPNNVTAQGYFNVLDTATYLCAYGCGGGWPLGAGGIGTTGNYAHDSVRSVFTTLFGSYFGDWGFANDFLRAPLASMPMALSCEWSGRPYWHFHFMASGQTLGYCTKWAQNNSDTYQANFAQRYMSIGLMGDPTLRLLTVSPAANLQLQVNDSTTVAMAWNHSPDTIRGYNIYRCAVLNGHYTRIASLPANDTTYIDSLPLTGSNYYMVRALKLEQTASGYYYNLSEGIIDSAFGIISGIEQVAVNNQLLVYPNPSSGAVTVSSTKQIDEIKITGVTGQLVYEARPKQTRFNFELNQDGIYFAAITSGGVKVTRKVTITK